MDSRKPVFPLPTEGELVAFPHGAAGHEGITSTAAGDLIIKPCTQAEIDFYEAAQSHPEFKYHMPLFMGKLQLGNATGVDLESAEKKEAEATDQTRVEVPQVTLVDQMLASTLTEDEQKDEVVKAWMPSGGKKIKTGLGIVLENAVADFKKPNVIDLKLGSRLWDDDAPEEKRKKLDQVAAETTSGSLGFRIAGAKLWLGDRAGEVHEQHTEIKDGYKSYNKHYGRNLDEQSVEKALARFISGTKPPVVYGQDKSQFTNPHAEALLSRLVGHLLHIQSVLEKEESRMYSASVLIVIEGDPVALQEALDEENRMEEEEERKSAAEKTRLEEEGEAGHDDEGDDQSIPIDPRIMEVRLIDFAHAKFTPGEGPDLNVINGIRNIIQILRNIYA